MAERVRRLRSCLARTAPGGAGDPPGGTTTPCDRFADGRRLSESPRRKARPRTLKTAAMERCEASTPADRSAAPQGAD
jgi:hypothetical protein